MPINVNNPPPITMEDLAPHVSLPGVMPIRTPRPLTFWGDLVPAIFRRETSLGSLREALFRGSSEVPEDGFNPRLHLPESMKDMTVEELAEAKGITSRAAAAILGSRSFGEYMSHIATIASEDRDRWIAGNFGFMSNLAAGLITSIADPLTYIPIGGQAVKGATAVRAAAGAGFKAAMKRLPGEFVAGAKVGIAAVGMSEMTLQATQLNRGIDESALNVAAGAVFSGGLRAVAHAVGTGFRSNPFQEDMKIGGVQDHDLPRFVEQEPQKNRAKHTDGVDADFQMKVASETAAKNVQVADANAALRVTDEGLLDSFASGASDAYKGLSVEVGQLTAKAADGTEMRVGAAYRNGKIIIDPEGMVATFERYKSGKFRLPVDPVGEFVDIDAFARFVLEHEKQHGDNPRLPNEPLVDFENRINKKAQEALAADAEDMATRIKADREAASKRQFGIAMGEAQKMKPEELLPIAERMASQGDPLALMYVAKHKHGYSGDITEVVRGNLRTGMEFTIGGQRYVVTPDRKFVIDGDVVVKDAPKELKVGGFVRVDKDSLDSASRRKYLVQAEADIASKQNYELLGSAGIGVAVAKMASPVIRIAASSSKVARDAVWKLMTVSGHLAAQVAGVHVGPSVQVRAGVLQNLWSTTYRKADDFRINLNAKLAKPLAEAEYGEMVSRYLISDKLINETNTPKAILESVKASADVIRKEFFDTFGKHAEDVFKHFKYEQGYFPRHIVKELVNTPEFLERVAQDIWRGWEAKSKTIDHSMQEAREIAAWIQNQWLSKVVERGQLSEAVASHDFASKWADKLGMDEEGFAKFSEEVGKFVEESPIPSRAKVGEKVTELLNGTSVKDPVTAAAEITNDLFSLPSSFASDEMAYRSFTKSRSVELSPELIADYTDTNLKRVMHGYAKQAAADIEITRTFGDPQMFGAMLAIRSDFNKLAEANPAQAAKLAKEYKWTVDRLSKFRDDLRGVLSVPSDPNHWYGRGLSLFRNLSYIAQSGAFFVSNIADAFQAGVTYGMKKVFWDGWLKYSTDLTLRKLNKAEARMAAEGMEGETARMIAGIEDVSHGIGTISPAEKLARGGSAVASYANLMAPFQDLVQNVSFTVGQTWLLKNVRKVGDGGALSKADTLWMSKLGLLDGTGKLSEMGAAIYQYRDGGPNPQWINRRGNLVANTAGWAPDAAAGFRYAMHHAGQLNRVMAGVGDKPLFFSSNMGKTLGQYKSFLFGSMSKIALMRLQQRDLRVLSTSVAQIGVGGMVYAMRRWAAGEEPTKNPEEMLSYGIEYSGLASFLFEADEKLRNMTGGEIGFNPLARTKDARLFDANDAAQAVFGPSYGLISNVVTGASEAVGGDRNEAIHNLRQAMPYNKVIGIKQAFDAAERAMKGK